MRRLALIPMLFMATARPADAQMVSGVVEGSVLDSAGAAIAGADVTITQTETGATRKGRTDENGTFTFPALAIGYYELAAVAPGFKRAQKKGIELHISDHLKIDIRLEVGEVTQEITVSADAVQVQTETSDQSHLISGEQVRELQLNGRSFMTLLELLPGVASDMPDRADPNTNPALSINGSRNSAASFNIDGGNNSDVIVGSGSLNTFTSIDTIAEFKVITSTFAAEYGRGGSAQINVVTRGGTRRFRGSLYEFLRNDAFDARDWFTHQVLPLKLNNFGYNLGGPVILPGYNSDRKKTFFFWTQEFNRLSTRGDAVNTTVPTLEMRRGDFRALGPGRDGVMGTEDDPVVDPLTGFGFPNGIIPPERIDETGAKLANLYPAPNFRGPGTINFTSAAPSKQDWREELIRIDHHLSPEWKLFGRWTQDSANIYNPYGGSSVTSIGTRFPGISATHATRPGKNLTVNMTNVFSQSLLNEFNVTYSGREITQQPVNEDATRTGLGIRIPELFPENIGDVIPNVTLGSNFATLGVSRVWLKQLFNFEWSNNLTKIHGRHTFKTGAIYSYGGNRENPTGPTTNGSFTFNTGFSKHPVANLLLGLPFTYSEAERLVVSHARFALLEVFGQDDFKIHPRVTLNYGLRYSNYFNPYDRDHVLTNFLPSAYDPAKAPAINPVNGQRIPGTGDPLNGIIVAGKNSPYGKYISENDLHLLGPRFGFAWDLSGRGKTALRGGYGWNYTRPLIGAYINSAFDNPPFSRSVTIQQPTLADPAGGAQAPEGTPSLTAIGTPMLAPTIQQWSTEIQQQVPHNTVLKVAYVGSHGTHLLRPINLNNPDPNLFRSRGVHVNAVRPYLGYGAITTRQSSASSIYHSLQVSVNRRFSNGLSYGFAYTLAKSIDDGSTERGTGDIPPDTRHSRAERAVSDFDRRHVFTANYIFKLPSAVDRRSMVAPVLNGWQISGITRMYSGTPLDVTLSTDVAGIGAVQNQRPNLAGDTRGPRTVERWFNIDAFARPENGTFGNLGRNALRRPGIHKWDLAIFKNFYAGERRTQVQFRAELFNAFNHASFDAPATSLTTTATGVNPAANSFGVITGTRDARVAQFALKIYY